MEQKLAVGVLAHRFMQRNPEVNVSPGFKAGLVAAVAVMMIAVAPTEARAQSFADTAVGANLGSAFDGLKQVGAGLFGAAKTMVQGSGLADVGNGVVSGVTSLGAKAVDGTATLMQRGVQAVSSEPQDTGEFAPAKLTVGQFEELGASLAQDAVSMKKGRMHIGTKEWRVKERTKDGISKVMNSNGDVMWLNAAGKPTDPRPGVAAIQHADGGFEHFQNGKLAAPAGSTLAARFDRDGFEFHIKDGELIQAAPVVEAKVKPVGPAFAMR